MTACNERKQIFIEWKEFFGEKKGKNVPDMVHSLLLTLKIKNS